MHMRAKMHAHLHTHRQLNGKESTDGFSQAASVESCQSPWEQTSVVHAQRGLRPPSVENSDNESSEGDTDQRYSMREYLFLLLSCVCVCVCVSGACVFISMRVCGYGVSAKHYYFVHVLL